MPLETSFNSIADLNVNWPTGPDLVNKGDDHTRGIKQALKNTFPQIDKPLTITADGLNAMAASVDATGAQITMKKPVDMGDRRVMSVAAPTSDADAANKKFVTDADAAVKASAVAESATNTTTKIAEHKAAVDAHAIANIVGLQAVLDDKVGSAGGHVTGPLAIDELHVGEAKLTQTMSGGIRFLNFEIDNKTLSFGYGANAAGLSFLADFLQPNGSTHLGPELTTGVDAAHRASFRYARTSNFRGVDLGILDGGSAEFIYSFRTNGGISGPKGFVQWGGESTSDARLKDDVSDITGSIDRICALRPVSFTWNSPFGGADIGVKSMSFIAQEAEQVDPRYVSTQYLNEDLPDLKAIYIPAIVADLVAVVQQLRHEIAQLRADAGL